MIYLTPKQIKWLNSRGGRTPDEVLEDEGGLYILMGRYEDQKVYIPDDKHLI